MDGWIEVSYITVFSDEKQELTAVARTLNSWKIGNWSFCKWVFYLVKVTCGGTLEVEVLFWGSTEGCGVSWYCNTR